MINAKEMKAKVQGLIAKLPEEKEVLTELLNVYENPYYYSCLQFAISCMEENNIPEEATEYENIATETADDLFTLNKDDKWDVYTIMMQHIEEYQIDMNYEYDMDTFYKEWNKKNNLVLFENSVDTLNNLVMLFVKLYGPLEEYVRVYLKDFLEKHLLLLEDEQYITTKDIQNIFKEFFSKCKSMSMDLYVLRELLEPDEVIATYITTDNIYVTYHAIINKNSEDIGVALEDTLHRLIEANKEEVIPEIMGAVKSDPEEDYISLDLGYVIPGSILSFKKL